MAVWFTVYCTRPVQQITPIDLVSHLQGPNLDWYTLAETFEIEDESVVDRATKALRADPATGDLGEWIEVRYRQARLRPLVVYLWSDPARVQQELVETQEQYLADRKGRGASQVRTALSSVVEVAAIELGGSQLSDMGLVIAGQIAEYLAEVGAGLIRDTGDEWWAIRRGVPKLLLGSD